jgi:hypothetical protein
MGWFKGFTEDKNLKCMDFKNQIVNNNDKTGSSPVAGRSPATGRGLHFNFLASECYESFKRRDGAIYPGLMAAIEGMDCRDGVRWIVCNCGHGVEAQAFHAEAIKITT